MTNPIFIESKNIRDMLPKLHFNSVLLLDLDDTVMQSQIELGSDQWFVQMFAEALEQVDEKTLTREQAIAAVLAIYHEIQQIVKVKPVEEKTAQLIQLIKSTGIPVIAVTARDHCLQAATERQLDSINAHFLSPKGFPQWADLENHRLRPGTKFLNGILYCSGQDKGLCLKELLDKVNFMPKHMVMVDDKQKNLDHLSQAITEMGADFVGVRYGHVDEMVQAFDMKKATKQLKAILPRLERGVLADIEQLNILEASSPEPPTPSSQDINRFFYSEKARPGCLLQLRDISPSAQ